MANLPDIGFRYYIFGSSDSLDTDVLIDHPESTGTEKDSKIIDSIKNICPEIKDWDINIVKIEDGIIINSIPSKGLPDSVHNSLFTTYNLHDQNHNFPLNKKLNRNIENAIDICLNRVFIFYKKSLNTIYYDSIPKEVKNGEAMIEERLEFLKEIDFKLKPFESKEKTLDFYKKIAFRIGQTISIIENIEIYTKDDFIKRYPDLSNIINRIALNDYSILNTYTNQLYKAIKRHYKIS